MTIKQVNVASRRSVKVGTEFITFEVGLVADIAEDGDADTVIKQLFEKVNGQVDDQIEESAKSLAT